MRFLEGLEVCQTYLHSRVWRILHKFTSNGYWVIHFLVLEVGFTLLNFAAIRNSTAILLKYAFYRLMWRKVKVLVTQSCPAPWTVACQTSLSMDFSRQEYWSGLRFPSPGDLPDPGIEPVSPALIGRFSYHCTIQEAPFLKRSLYSIYRIIRFCCNVSLTGLWYLWL